VEAALQPPHPIDQVEGIRELLDVLTPVRLSDHQLEIITVGLPPDFVMESGMVAFKEPQHAPGISV
jgi:hypothetical protein